MLTIIKLLIILIIFSVIINIYRLNLYFYRNILFLISFFILTNIRFNQWYLISINIGINIFSFGMVLLTIWVIGIIYIILNEESNLKECFNILFFIMIVILINFIILRFIWFYFIFEVSLILIFYVIIKWGAGTLRVISGYYLIFYTLFFSLPLLFILFSIINLFGRDIFIIIEINNNIINMIIFIYILGSFLVKLPIYILHNWLLKAHVEAPVFGSMILAAIILKLGSYGLLRLIYILYNNFVKVNIYLIELRLIGSVILRIICLRQIDIKIIIALSSVVHIGLILRSILTILKLRLYGSYIIIIAHGLCSSGLFFILNLNYKITNSRLIIINKGVIVYIPSITLMWFLLCSSNIAAPLSLNLVREVILLIGLIIYLKIFIIKLFIYCLLRFIYSLYFFRYMNHGNSNYNIHINIRNIKNYLVLLFHWFPLNLIFFNLDIFI